MFSITQAIIASFSLTLVCTAQALDLGQPGLEAGSGPYLFSSKNSNETDKSGLVAFGSLTRRIETGRGYLSGAVGFGWTSIEGQNAVAVQKINQAALIFDTSYLFNLGQFSIGAGAHHIAGPGAANEFQQPTTFAWSVYAGPRARYEILNSALAINASFDTSLNLRAGRGSFFLLSLAYRYGDSEPSPATVEAEPAKESNQQVNRESQDTLPTAALKIEREIKLDSRELIFGRNHKQLPLRLKSYLGNLAESLLGPHSREWDYVEISVPSPPKGLIASQASAINTFLLENGIDAARVRISQNSSGDGIEIRVHTFNLGMIGYLESRDRTFISGRMRYSLNANSKLVITQFRKLKASLLDRAWAWSYATVVVYVDGKQENADTLKSLRQLVQGSPRMDLLEIQGSERRNDLEIDGVRDNPALSRIFNDE